MYDDEHNEAQGSARAKWVKEGSGLSEEVYQGVQALLQMVRQISIEDVPNSFFSLLVDENKVGICVVSRNGKGDDFHVCRPYQL